jgi:hypothetical protein
MAPALQTRRAEVVMKTAGSILALALAAGIGACSHQKSAQNASAQLAQTQANSNSSCPIAQLPGVRASVADTRNGVAITFTAPQDEIDQLRRGVRAMADAADKQGNAFAACPCAFAETGAAETMPDGPNAQSQWNPTTSTPSLTMIRAKSKVENISSGAVLKLSASDKSQVPALRDEVHNEVLSLRSNGCLRP